mmetsp:Transcript_5840/g.12774  ORF Transcript_5840/g.12774 Transcript_5840/m.12774 type:complete len:337 (-) Transcript_5840:170-1180(-)
MACSGEDLLIDISQRIQVMRAQETTNYVVPDYLADEWQQKLRDAAEWDEVDGSAQQRRVNAPSPSSSISSLSDISPSSGSVGSKALPQRINKLWREKICEWCYQIVDTYDFNREVVSITMSYLDRYLATRIVNSRIFQLAAMTALYLAVKLYEPGKLRVSSLVHLSRGFFMADHIVTMEHSMLEALRWHVHPPTPIAFCRDLMHLVSGEVPASARHDVNELARFMTELSVCDYWFATKRPSSIALAAIINAIDLQGPQRIGPKDKSEFLHWVVEIGMDIANDVEIIECYGRLRKMYVATGFTPHLGEGAAEEENAEIGNQSQELVEEVAIHPLIAM